MAGKLKRFRAVYRSSSNIGAVDLNALLANALKDKTLEPVFLRALLVARVYAHVPRAMQGRRLAFIQFPLPETGRLALPFFSDEQQARAAAGTRARVIAMKGRQLLELTRGATLVLNPNGATCTLYPEEIAALLDRGEVAAVEKLNAADVTPSAFREPDPAPAWLIAPLIGLYLQLPAVEAAYLVEVRYSNDSTRETVGLLVAVSVDAAETEHVARATITLIQPLCRAVDVPVDLTAFVPDIVPGWIQHIRLTPFYLKSERSLLFRGPDTLQ